MRQPEIETQRDLGVRAPGRFRYITSQDIWLALDDTPQEKRLRLPALSASLETIGLAELETYHRQLFYWLLIRCGPCIFPVDLDLEQGVPIHLQTVN